MTAAPTRSSEDLHVISEDPEDLVHHKRADDRKMVQLKKMADDVEKDPQDKLKVTAFERLLGSLPEQDQVDFLTGRYKSQLKSFDPTHIQINAAGYAAAVERVDELIANGVKAKDQSLHQAVEATTQYQLDYLSTSAKAYYIGSLASRYPDPKHSGLKAVIDEYAGELLRANYAGPTVAKRMGVVFLREL